MNEFIFGGFLTLEQRVTHERDAYQGVQHRHLLQPRAPGAGDQPLVTVTVALPHAVERVVCTIHEPHPAVVELHPDDVEWNTLNWRYVQIWRGRLPVAGAGTLVRYTIDAYPAGGGEPIPADDGETFSYLVGKPGPPAWAREAIVYQIFPDRFHPGHGNSWRPAEDLRDIHGGTLRGIIEHLDYVADLGFNCIWLNPFFPDETHHGYHATDYFDVNPRLGTMDDLHELVEAAHARDLRLLLDFVANHWGRQHPTFQAALQDPDSPYVDWYHWEAWPDRYKTFFGVRELPKINVDHPEARSHLLRAAEYWLRDVGFDGYRLDYALGPSHDFWTEFRATVKAARPDAWIFGEVVDPPPVQLSYDGRLDGALDFLLMQVLRDTFAFQTMDVAAFDGFLGRHDAYFPAHFSRPTFLDNHDVNRFLWLTGDDTRKLKLAALCQFTLSAPPIVYYGTEVGVSQKRDIVQEHRHAMEEARAPMLWGDAQDTDLHQYYRWLIRFRRDHPVLWHGRRRTLHLDPDAGTYAYARAGDDETVVVALNVGDMQRTVKAADHRFELPPWSGDLRLF